MGRSLEEQRKTVARNLCEAMDAQGKTRKDLAAKFNISMSSAANWCTGVKKPKTETLVELAEWLHVPQSFLWGNGAFVNWTKINADREGFLRAAETALGEDVFRDTACLLYSIDPQRPYEVPLSEFAYFINDLIEFADLAPDGWVVTPKNTKAPALASKDKRSDIQVIFDQLSPANQAKLLELSLLYLSSQNNTEEKP